MTVDGVAAGIIGAAITLALLEALRWFRRRRRPADTYPGIELRITGPDGVDFVRMDCVQLALIYKYGGDPANAIAPFLHAIDGWWELANFPTEHGRGFSVSFRGCDVSH